MTENPLAEETRILRLIRKAGIVRPRDLARQGVHRTQLVRMVEAGLVERISRGVYVAAGHEFSVNLAAAIVATQGQRAIADIAADVQVSPRVLQRRFGAAVGISPKAFAVLRRARSALKRVVDDGVGRDVGGWSGVALASGYADQAHFVREVARLTRFAPTALRARLDTIEHEQLAD